MDIVGTTLSAAQTLFGALQCLELRETMSIFGYKNQLDDLQATVSYIQKVLHDAEVMQELSHENRLWVEEIKDAIFEADDLLDEFVTLSEQEKLRDAHAGGSLSNKLRSFFSESKAPGVAYRMSKGVKKIKKKFDAISDNRRYSLNLDVKLVRKKGVKTCSFVKADEVIGREDDLEKIVGMLLDSDVQRDVSFLTVVGMGGLGKTTLAQLVYNDPRVKNAFSLRKWAWVSDLVPEQLDVTEILGKILDKNHEGSTMDLVQSQFNKLLAGEKYLLVLDDVWTENCYQWRTLVRYFTGGQRGSWIVVTTRSLETARIVGNGPTWKLQGLSKEHSWRLFERNAFELGQSNPPNDLVQIGEEIVDRCGQVPIAISAVGSLLYGQDKSKWLSLLAIGLANIRERKNDIMPILMLSYHNLESPIKICFSYCAVFPKNFLIKKKILISLWIAQGYIVPLDEGQSIEDAGEEYFSILLQRCFFQALGNEEDGTIRIHDLMHDIAQKVMGKELCTTKTCSGNLDKKVRHLSLARSKFAMFSFNKTHIRSYFYAGYWHHDSEMDSFPVEALVPSCTCLRALDLAWSKITSLPESIGGL